MPAPSLPDIVEQGWTYRFGAALGDGGYATVYRATMSDTHIERRVAIKVLQHAAAADPEAVARLRDEARILARLDHPAIVRVLGTLDANGRPAVVMDLIDGVDLRCLQQSGPVPARAACEIASTIANALASAWSDPDPITGVPLRVIHRDIKPANILISRRGHVKLVDFGVARAAIHRDGQTRSVHQFGTERYMAPERYDDATTHRSDVYALAITMVEALTGKTAQRLPVRREHFQAAQETLLQPLWLLDAPPPWKAEVIGLLEEMLHYDEGRRPTAEVVAARLDVLAREAPGEGMSTALPARVQAILDSRDAFSASTVNTPVSASLVPAPLPATTSGTLHTPAPAPQKRVHIALVSAAAVFLVGGGVLVWRVVPARLSLPEAPVVVAEPLPATISPPDVDPSASADILSSEEPIAAPSPAPTRASPPQTRPAATTTPKPAEAAAVTVSFSLSAGAGGTVTIDAKTFPLPHAAPLAPGLHAVSFEQRGVRAHQMIYVGDSSPTRHVFDTSTGLVHSF